MTYLFLLIAIFISLFILFEFSRNDFVLLRKNISLSQMFDYSLITILVSIVFARLFYILDSQNYFLFYPISFLHIFRLPGLSFFGFFVGSALILFLLLRRKKVLHRVYDIFFISTFPILLFSIISMDIPKRLFYIPMAFFAIGIIIFIILLHFLRNYVLKDGSVTIIFFIVVSFFSLGNYFFVDSVRIIPPFTFLQIANIVSILVLAIYFLIHQEVFKKK